MHVTTQKSRTIAPRRRRHIPRMDGLEPRELLTALTVTSLADSGPGTLRGTITQANSDQSSDSIGFANGLSGTITLESALPDLSASMSLIGPGSSLLNLTRDPAPATPAFRILTIDQGATVLVSGLTISGGGSTQTQTQIAPTLSAGGGIANHGTLTVSLCTISHNMLLGNEITTTHNFPSEARESSTMGL
jgi:hypothetical protein